MFTKKLYFAALAAIFLTSSANAVIGPIKISLNTEYRTSSPVIGSIATTIKLDKAAIKSTGAKTFTELLQYIPSISYEGGQGALNAVRLRGNEADHTLLLLDGMKVTLDGGQANLDVIPVDQIERIEISKGPFSSLYGPGAIGGVIHVFTDKNADSISSNKIDISYGSKGTSKINLNSYFKNEKSYLDIALTGFHTDGIDATGDGDLDPIDRKTTGINFGTELTDSTDISVNFLNTRANIQYDSSFGTPKPDNNLNQVGLGLTQKVNEKFKINLDIMNQRTQRRGNKYRLNTMSIINEFDFDNSKLSVGLMNSTDKDIGNTRQIKHTDIFSQWQGLIIDNEISIGARIVDHDKFKTHTTYNLNWGRDLSSTLRVNGSYGTASHLPNHYENNANIVVGRTALKPEHSKNLELGLTGDYGWGNVELKVYKSKLTNAFIYNGDNWPLDYYTNGGVVNIQGAELSLGTNLLGWDLDTSLDFNKAIAASTDLQKGRRPNRSISLNLSKASGKWKRNINWIAKSRAWDKDDHSNGENGGYGLLNLTTSYSFNDDLTVYLNRNNALDKNYEMAKGYKTLGKTSTLGLTYNF
ncbi:TonB-dependent receptor [Candidatus Thioglobus sp.]|nr:TonB-dependent receptor [Candidatus Thioglobus sp.]